MAVFLVGRIGMGSVTFGDPTRAAGGQQWRRWRRSRTADTTPAGQRVTLSLDEDARLSRVDAPGLHGAGVLLTMIGLKLGFLFGFTFVLYWFGLKQAKKKAVGPVWFGLY